MEEKFVILYVLGVVVLFLIFAFAVDHPKVPRIRKRHCKKCPMHNGFTCTLDDLEPCIKFKDK